MTYVPDDTFSDTIDKNIFNEILELDDNDERNFTRSLVEEYFSIGWTTSKRMMSDL